MTNKSRSNISTAAAADQPKIDARARLDRQQARPRVRIGWFRNEDTGETTPVYEPSP